MLRGGFGALDPEQRQLFKEMRAQTVGTGSEGGFTVPTEFRNRVAEATRKRFYGDGETPYTPPKEPPKF